MYLWQMSFMNERAELFSWHFSYLAAQYKRYEALDMVCNKHVEWKTRSFAHLDPNADESVKKQVDKGRIILALSSERTVLFFLCAQMEQAVN